MATEREFSKIKALTFDVGGTIFNWHDTIVEKLSAFGTSRGIDVDWPDFANQWRAAAAALVIDAKTSDIPLGNMEGSNRLNLDKTLKAFGIDCVSDSDKDEICGYWHIIPPWPDVRKAMKRLRGRYIVSTLTILSAASIINASKRAGLQWDCIISCEMFDHYKFHPEAYRRGVELLGCEPEEVLMVAAHNHDLEAAARIGMRTAYVDRPKEFGSDAKMNAEAAARGVFKADIVGNTLDDLADALGLPEKI